MKEKLWKLSLTVYYYFQMGKQKWQLEKISDSLNKTLVQAMQIWWLVVGTITALGK